MAGGDHLCFDVAGGAISALSQPWDPPLVQLYLLAILSVINVKKLFSNRVEAK